MLTDNGVAQKVDAVSSDTLSIDVTLVLDLSESMKGALLDGLKAATRQFTPLLRASDTVRVIGVQHVIEQVIRAQPGDARIAVEAFSARGSTALHDGLLAALLRRTAPDRRALVLAVTDGLDTASFSGREVLESVAKRADATVHILFMVESYRARQQLVTPSGRFTGESPENLVSAFRAIAESTGGLLVPMDPKESLSAAFKRTVEDFRQAYVLRYTPRNVPLPGWHDLSIRVARAGRYEVRARRGYFGG